MDPFKYGSLSYALIGAEYLRWRRTPKFVTPPRSGTVPVSTTPTARNSVPNTGRAIWQFEPTVMPHTVTPPSTFSTAADSEPCSRLVAGGQTEAAAAAAGRSRSSVDEAIVRAKGGGGGKANGPGPVTLLPYRDDEPFYGETGTAAWLDERTSLGRSGRVAQCAPCPAVERTGRYDARIPSCMIHERAHAAWP